MGSNPGDSASGRDDSSALVPKSVMDSFLCISKWDSLYYKYNWGKIRPMLQVGGRIMSAFVPWFIFRYNSLCYSWMDLGISPQVTNLVKKMVAGLKRHVSYVARNSVSGFARNISFGTYTL